MVQGCRVDGATTVQPPLYHPRDTSLPLTLTRGKLCRWRVPGRHLFGSSREGKVVRNRGEKIFFFPCFARPGEEEDPQCLQNGTVSAPFSSFFMNSVWNGVVSFKWKGSKMCQSSHWSSFCDLFNCVLNCNFNCKNQFNYIAGLEVGRLFQIGPWSWLSAIWPSIE
jgi:hypothetical protein